VNLCLLIAAIGAPTTGFPPDRTGAVRPWSMAAVQNQTGEFYRMDGRTQTRAGHCGRNSGGAASQDAEDPGDSRPSPRTEYLISSAVQWADRIMTRIDGVFGNSPMNRKQ
jgi:hypothetical protein